MLIGLSALYQVFFPLAQGNQFSLILFLAAVLPLTLLCYRSGLRWRRSEPDAPQPNPTVFDWLLAVLALLVCLYPLLPLVIGDGGGGFDAFLGRQGAPAMVDVIAGSIVLLLVIEACRRTTGLALPIVCLVALGYAYYGGYLPQNAAIAHAGVDWDQIVSATFLQSTGLYGVPLDVAATYIVLFTIYGAVLDASGASKFFIDLSFAAFRRSRAAPGRTVTLAGFLLGSVSGSGTATTVSLGSLCWPVLRRAGYPSENAGGMLAAAGIGAILSPPTMGAAAFIIAEYLGVPYLTVLIWAIVPTLLYYLGILLAVESDARRYGAREVEVATESTWRLLGRFGYHLISLVLIVVFLAVGVPAFKAVVYATVAQIVLAYLDKEHRMTPARLYQALADGVRGVLGVAAPAAAMFVFYFAVLSEVTPPTALASVAASAITGGRVIPTMWQTWKYTLPAFLVPFAFVLTDNGEALLGLRSFTDTLWTAVVSAVAVAALAVVTGGWLVRRAGWPERVLCAPAAALLLYLSPPTVVAGLALLAVAVAVHLVLRRRELGEPIEPHAPAVG